MQKILLTLIVAICTIGSVCADDSLNCDATDIGATSPKARLRATWTPNTYNISWYADEDSTTPLSVQSAAQTCSYGSDLVIPDSAPTKIGYTFIGWEVAEANPLLSVDINISGNSFAGHSWNDNDNADLCYSGGYSSVDITDCPSDLLLNEWKVEFSYGTVKGTSVCNNTVPNNFEGHFVQSDATEEEYIRMWNALWGPGGTGVVSSDSFNSGTTGASCWCRATSYTPTNGYSQNLTSLPWVFFTDEFEFGEYCALYCPIYCAFLVQDFSDFKKDFTKIFRTAVFGINQ